MNILVSWLGSNDIYRLNRQDIAPSGSCALVSLLENPDFGPFDELCLFASRDLPRREQDEANRDSALRILEGLSGKAGARLHIAWAPENARTASPEKLWDFCRSELRRRYSMGEKFYYNITSGTSLMATIQFRLNEVSEFRGVALYTFPADWQAGEARTGNVYSAQLPDQIARLDGSEKLEVNLYTEPNRKIFETARLKVAPSDASVLILGATGTGKSELAAYIHQHDPRRMGRELVEINCAAFGGDLNIMRSELFGHEKGAFTGAEKPREGAFRKADKGILFLDEIGEIPIQHQGLLLRVLQTGLISPLGAMHEIKVDVRIIAATNVDLAAAIREGRFREDLYYRLAQYTPRLKSIQEYTPLQKERLLDSVLEGINRKARRREPRILSPAAREALLRYDWPGNIRQLNHMLSAICLLSDEVIQAEDVLEQMDARNLMHSTACAFAAPVLTGAHCPESDLPDDLDGWLSDWEGYWMDEALFHHPKQKDAARRLGVASTTFNNRLKIRNAKRRSA